MPAPLDDALLDEFEEAWERGPAPALEAFWARVRGKLGNDAARQRVLAELVKIDLHRRWRTAAPASHPLIETYLTRFPELGGAARAPADLIAEEFCARRLRREAVQHDEYYTRFPTRAAELRAILEQTEAELIPSLPALEQAVTAAAPKTESVAAFVERLTALPILMPDHQRQSAQPGFKTRFADVAGLIRFLRENGWLTAYQIEQLTLGRTHALTVGPYVLLDRLGEGATSVVFRARHRHLQRMVALKVIRKELLRDVGRDVLERVNQEFRAAGRVSHPHVVHAYDAGPVGSTLFIAMEYVRGVNLRELVEKRGAVPHAQACDYVRQACLALHHAACNGIVHRDVKPSNLIVSGLPGSGEPALPGHPWGLVKLLDLGLARIHHLGQTHSSGMLTQKGTLMGTADYMAPEQALDAHTVDVRADLYSLGCTLYFFLAGKPPFAGGTFVQKMERHQHEEALPIEGLVPGVPANVAGVVRRLLAKRPEDRFATPGDVFVALGGTAVSLPETPTLAEVGADSTIVGFSEVATYPALARHVPFAAPAPAGAWRMRLLMAVAAGLLLLIVVAGGIAGVLWKRMRHSPSPDAPPTAVAEHEVLRLALGIECGRKEGEVRQMSPRYSYQLMQGAPWDSWPVVPPAKSYCWFDSNTLQFELRMPPRTVGILRLYFFDGDANLRRQRLTVQGRNQGVFKEFATAEKIVEVPISAEDTRLGRIEVKIENVSPAANCVVSTVEFLERRMVPVTGR
jgi:tRNA A-37 threonylcarbamoyl transferase component Bud32